MMMRIPSSAIKTTTPCEKFIVGLWKLSEKSAISGSCIGLIFASWNMYHLITKDDEYSIKDVDHVRQCTDVVIAAGVGGFVGGLVGFTLPSFLVIAVPFGGLYYTYNYVSEQVSEIKI